MKVKIGEKERARLETLLPDEQAQFYLEEETCDIQFYEIALKKQGMTLIWFCAHMKREIDLQERETFFVVEDGPPFAIGDVLPAMKKFVDATEVNDESDNDETFVRHLLFAYENCGSYCVDYLKNIDWRVPDV